MDKFAKLTNNIRQALASSTAALEHQTYGMQTLPDQPWDVANKLSWRAEGWLSESATLHWAMRLVHMLERITLEAVEEGIPPDEVLSSDSKWWDDKADSVRRDALAQILVESFRNDTGNRPIDVLSEIARRKALSDALEMIGLSRYLFNHEDLAGDILDGIDRRRREEADRRAKHITRVEVHYDGRHYLRAIAFNSNGAELARAGFGECPTKRMDAHQAALEWVSGLTGFTRTDLSDSIRFVRVK